MSQHPRPSGCHRARALPITAAALVVLMALVPLACGGGARANDARALDAATRAAIADTIARQVIAACDLRAPGAVERLMSLYPTSGPAISASAGHVTTTRDSLQASVATFWANVGRNMRDPRWQWTSMRVDVLAPNAAVMTATYRIAHLTPAGIPHTIGGAWTAVFERRAGRWVIVHEHLSDAAAP